MRNKNANRNAMTYTTTAHACQASSATVGSAAARGLSLEKVVLLNDEVVHELDAKIGLGLDVVLDVDHAVDLDVDGEAVRCELRRYFFIDLNEHIVTALDDGLFRLFLAHAIRQAQLVERDLRDEVVERAVVDFLSL